MSFNKFSAATMIAISDPMVDPEQDRELLASHPFTAALLPYIAAAHNDLLRVQVRSSNSAQKIREMAEQAAALDEVHDERYKSFYTVLTTLAAMSDNAMRQTLEEIRDTLMPDGISGVQNSYLAESGRVELAMSLVTPEMEKTLEESFVLGKSLHQLFSDWANVGRELGALERERTRLSETADKNAITPADVQKARFKWIRTMNMLVDFFDLEPNLSEEMHNHILQPLRTAEAKHARKNKTATAEAEPEETSEETPQDAPQDTPAASGE